MTKFTAFVILVALRLIYQPSYAAPGMASFASPSSVISYPPAKLISFKGSLNKDKVLLHWVVGENETADQFEVEKSIDGKTFEIAALVFGTDKPDIDNYRFYEKNNGNKVFYRIKLINKNNLIEYSNIVVIKRA